MDNLRTNITTTLQHIGEQTGNYATPWTITYKRLIRATRNRYRVRLNHKRDKAIAKGLGKTEVDRLCILDVLSKAEMQLYWYIVKEYSNKYKGDT
jgi:hypothetical protein